MRHYDGKSLAEPATEWLLLELLKSIGETFEAETTDLDSGEGSALASHPPHPTGEASPSSAPPSDVMSRESPLWWHQISLACLDK